MGKKDYDGLKIVLIPYGYNVNAASIGRCIPAEIYYNDSRIYSFLSGEDLMPGCKQRMDNLSTEDILYIAFNA